MTVRAMIPGDHSAVQRLIDEAAARGELLSRSEAYLRRHEKEFLVAAENNHVGGCASLHVYSPRLAEIIAFTVTLFFRKKGYGTLLIKKCQTRAATAGVQLVLIIASSQEAAFLKKLGFGPATASERYGLFWSVQEAPPFDRNLIRPAEEEDLLALSRLITTATQRGELLPRLLAELREHRSEFFVARGGGPAEAVVGGAALEIYSQDLAEVRSLVVAPDWARQNYGKHLVRACQARARERKVGEVLVVTSQVKFFRELGFKRATRADCLAFFWHPS